MVELRHELLGQTELREFAALALRRLHCELACALTDPGEAARHHGAEGERAAGSTSELLPGCCFAPMSERLAGRRGTLPPWTRRRRRSVPSECCLSTIPVLARAADRVPLYTCR